MRVIIQKSKDEVAVWIARYIASRINNHCRATSKPFVLGLPTGSSPLGTYTELIRLCNGGEVSFANVVTFNMDEYVALAEDHPESYHSFMWKNFFSHVDIKHENINILNGNAVNLATECENYEKRIVDAGGIDLFFGGVGSDGHVAFNEPFSSMASRTRVKSLTMETMIDNSRFFDNDINKVPHQSLTVGVATVMSATEVIIAATGHNKARALAQTIEGAYSHTCTLSALQNHQNGIIVCDEDATNELKVGTYRYFKQIEKTAINPMSIKI